MDLEANPKKKFGRFYNAPADPGRIEPGLSQIALSHFSILKQLLNFASCSQFMTAMGDSEETRECAVTCLPNCEETTYTYRVDTSDLKYKKLCKDAAWTSKGGESYKVSCQYV